MTLDRVTVLGRAFVHRLQASDAILGDFAVAEDSQDGGPLLRGGTGSRVPREYCSVTTAAGAPLFTSTAFGEPAFGQLLKTADRAIVAGAAGATITAGAETGSEMGAYWSESRDQGARAAHQVRRVHAARPDTGGGPCHLTTAARTAKGGGRQWAAIAHA